MIISDYYESERYPGPMYFVPGIREIEQNLEIAKSIYQRIEKHINA
jgi:hypothetical protein